MPLQTYTYNRVKYFVDYRLQEFRSDTDIIKWIPFDSELGDRILTKMINENVADCCKIHL